MGGEECDPTEKDGKNRVKSIKQDMKDRNLTTLPILLPNGGILEATFDRSTDTFRVTKLASKSKENPVSLQEVKGVKQSPSGAFPYTISDLDYYVIKRKDGVTAKYVMRGGSIVDKSSALIHLPGVSSQPYKTTLSDFCHHTPITSIFGNKEKQVFIADFNGLKSEWKKFDNVVDCGKVLPVGLFLPDPIMIGDEDFVDKLIGYTIPEEPDLPRVIQLDWPDREAPPLHPQFFVDLESELKGSTVVSCVGGHGRSGTTMVCLMMVMFKDYTPFTAMCHLRSLHCPRAIEGMKQHDYIGKFGEYLGRPNDMNKVSGVKSFKESFLGLNVKSAKPYQAKLVAGKKE